MQQRELNGKPLLEQECACKTILKWREHQLEIICPKCGLLWRNWEAQQQLWQNIGNP